MFGGYQYSLKMFVFEKVRSKRFPWAWSFIEAAQAPFLFLGMPLFNLLDWSFGHKSSIYLGVGLVFLGSSLMFFIDYFKAIGRKKRRTKQPGKNREETCIKVGVEEARYSPDEELDDQIVVGDVEDERRNSLPDVDDDFLPPLPLPWPLVV